MDRLDYFERGRELYNGKRYEEAAEYFLLSIVKERSNVSRAWLAGCYEYGLGVGKDLHMAKDLYHVSYNNIGHSKRNTKFCAWVQERLEQLKGVADCNSMSRFIDGIGNVKVIKNLNGPESPQLRYNINETVVSGDLKDTFAELFYFAEENIPRVNKEWTCDGKNRFHDGYTLDTHHFRLLVTRGCSDSYTTRLDDRDCYVTFPKNANLNYIYVQETILKKVKEVIFKRAQVVIPQVMQRVSERINAQYRNCIVVKALRGFWALYDFDTHDVTFCAGCVQLPEKSLEALCIHELTHSFVRGHDKDFHDKMLELGGQEMCDLDNNLWKEKRWLYLEI